MEDRIKCPLCGELIMATAKKCRFCGEWLVQDSQPPVTSAPPNVSIAKDNNETPPQPPVSTPPEQDTMPPIPPMQTTSATEHTTTVNTDGKIIINSFAEVWPKMLPGRFIHYAVFVWFGAVIMEIMFLAGMGSSSDYYDLIAKSTFMCGMAGYTIVIMKNFKDYGLHYDKLMIPLAICMFLKSILTSAWELGILLSGYLYIIEGALMIVLALKVRAVCQGTIRNIAGWILAFGIMYIPLGIFNTIYSFMDVLWYSFATIKRINYAATGMTGDLIWGILYFIACLKISKMFNAHKLQTN